MGVVLLLTILAGATGAVDLTGQAVTWADFGFINRVTSSMSYVYYATTEGILRYDKIKKQWLDPLTGTYGPPDEEIRSIWVDRFDKRLYVDTPLGMYEYNSFLDRWYTLTDLPEVENDISHISPPRTLLPPHGFNYSDDGLLIDPHSRRFEITDVINDGEGNLWMGTWGFGPLKANATSKFVSVLPYGLLQNRVNAIEEVDGLYYIGGAYFDEYRTGVSVFNYEDNTFDYIESGVTNDFPRTDINCLEYAGEYLLIGTPLGMYRYNFETKMFAGRISRRNGLTDDNVLSILATGDSIFVGTADGLSLLTREGDTAQFLWPEQFVNRQVYDFEQVGDDIWIASSGGAYRLKTRSGELQQFHDPTLVLFGGVYSLDRAGDHLWLLSGSGVLRLNVESGETTPYSQVFPRAQANAIAANDTICAVASDAGLTIIFHTADPVIERTFTVDDGLASNIAFSLDLFGDYIWVGTQDGLTLFWWNNPSRVD